MNTATESLGTSAAMEWIMMEDIPCAPIPPFPSLTYWDWKEDTEEETTPPGDTLIISIQCMRHPQDPTKKLRYTYQSIKQMGAVIWKRCVVCDVATVEAPT